jgi:hypothetical protein
MQKSYDRARIRLAQSKGGHPLVRTPRTKNRSNLVSPHVFGDKLGTREVWSGLAPCRIASMAETTLRRKPQLAGLNLLDRVALRRRSFRPGLRGRALRWARRTFRLTFGLCDRAGRGNQSRGPNQDRLSHALSHTGEIRS